MKLLIKRNWLKGSQMKLIRVPFQQPQYKRTFIRFSHLWSRLRTSVRETWESPRKSTAFISARKRLFRSPRFTARCIIRFDRAWIADISWGMCMLTREVETLSSSLLGLLLLCGIKCISYYVYTLQSHGGESLCSCLFSVESIKICMFLSNTFCQIF